MRYENSNEGPSRRTLLRGGALVTAAAGLPWLAPTQASAAVHGGEHAAAAPRIKLVWMAMANWLFEVDGTTVLMDGYMTRLPEDLFTAGPTGPLDLTTGPAVPDEAAISTVHHALGVGRNIDFILHGHSHFDHSFDGASWMRRVDARLVGSRTSCFQARAWGTPSDRCRIIEGGERLSLGRGLEAYVMRWNHSGTPGTLQHDPIELDAVPVPDPETGGLRAGVAEDFPNGGGGRAFLFVLEGGGRRVSLLWINSGSPADFDVPIVVDGQNFGAPSENLSSTLASAGVEEVDLAILPNGAEHADRVAEIAHPRFVIPHHWDGLFQPLFDGMPFEFSNPEMESALAARGAEILLPDQYFDAWILDPSGVRRTPNHGMQRRLGLAGVPAGKRSPETAGSCC